jgi:PAS domain S-box-containing protein
MLEFVRQLFEANNSLPDGAREPIPPDVIRVQTAGDVFIGIGCCAIVLLLLYFIQRRESRHPQSVILFALFFLLCGFVHLGEAAIYEYPLYRLVGLLKVATALAAWIAILASIAIIARDREPRVESTLSPPATGRMGDTALHGLVAPPKWDRWNDYTVAVLVAILALMIRWAIDPFVKHDYLFVMALLGVVFVSWRSGFGPGIVTLLLSLIGMAMLFLRPHQSWLGDLLATGMFFFCGVCCTGLGEAQWIARRRAKAALSIALERKAELEVEVARRREAESAIRLREAELTELNHKLALAQEETVAALAQIEALVLNAPVAIALLDRSLHFIRVNRVFAETTQRPLSHHPGKTIQDLGPSFPPELVQDCERVLQSGEPALDRRLVTRGHGNSGSIWRMSIFPVMGFEGRSIGLGFIGQDVTERELAADALRESEERFRSMADSVPVLIWLSDLEPRRTYFNKTWLEFTGRSLEQEMGDGWIDQIHPEDRDRAVGLYLASFAERQPFDVEYRLRRHDGEYRWVLSRGTPRFTPGGLFAGFSGSCLDVTDRKVAEEAVLRSERNLTDFFENANVGLHWGAEDGTILRANRAELEMLGYSQEEYVGQHLFAFHTESVTALNILERLRRGERVDNCPAQLRCKNGGVRDVLISSTALWEEGRFMHTRTFTRDVTEQKRVEEYLRASEIRYRTLTEAIPQLVWNTAQDGRATYFNQRWLDYTGMSPEQSQGWGWMEAIHPDDRERIRSVWRTTVQEVDFSSEARFSQEFRLRHGQRMDYRWFLSVAVPLRGASGEIDQWIGAMADIHDQKTATEAIAASERFYRAIGESIEYGVWTADHEGRFTYASSSFLKLLGLTQQDYAESGWIQLLDPREAEPTLAAWNECVRTGSRWSWEHRYRGVDGQWHPILARGVPVTDDSGQVAAWVGIHLDISDQKRAEQEVLDREARFRTLTEAIPQMVWTANPRGSITFFNRRWNIYTGLPQATGALWEWRELVHPDDGEQLRQDWQVAVAHEAREFSAEFRLRRAEDGAYRWMLANAISLRDSSDAIIEWVGSIADIDDQKRQAETLEQMVRERTTALLDEVEERKRMEQQLRAVAVELERSNKELEQFAYVASHDLQEPLRKIQAFGDRLRNRFRDSLPEAGQEYVERMHVSAARMRRLIDDLLTFSRVTTQARPFVRVDLEKLALEVVSDLDEYINQSGGKVEVGHLPTLDADPTQMRQLFQNLIANAIKFHRPQLAPLVVVQGERQEARLPNTDSQLTPSCRLTVRDNGIGFDEKYLDRIFQVFQRLHGRDEYEGTGVGLAICCKIVERHGGTITAQSRVGEGTTFVVVLPLRQSAEENATDVRPE